MLSLGFLFRHPKVSRQWFSNLASTTRAYWAGQTLIVKGVFLLLCTALGLDFVFSTLVESFAGNSADTYVHLSRIVSIMQEGFNIQSGFFTGIAETGYHYNIVYALYVPPSFMFDLPYEVWKYSFGFFRLLQWLSIFTLAWYVWGYWLKARSHTLLAASSSTLFAMASLSALFYTAVYPNQIVNLWLILLVIAISLYERGYKAAIFAGFGLAFLATATHPTYSLMAAMLLALILLLRFIIERNKIHDIKNTLLFYGGTIAILMLGPVRTALFPYQLSEKQQSLGGFPTVEIGGLLIKRPDNVLSYPWTKAGLVLLGTTGLIFLLVKLWRQKRQWAVGAALILFFPLVVYQPLGFGVVSNLLPLWVVERFTAMNSLRLISVPLGVYGVILVVTMLVRKRSAKRADVLKGLTWQLTVGFTLLLCAVNFLPSYQAVAKNRVENDHYYRFMDRISRDFGNVLDKESVVVASTGDSYLLPAVLPVKVLAIEEGHTSPVADAVNRLKCQTYVMTTLRYEELKTVKADYVVIAKYDKTYGQQRLIADQTSYLDAIAENQEFYIYEFLPNQGSASQAVYQPCLQYIQNEKN